MNGDIEIYTNRDNCSQARNKKGQDKCLECGKDYYNRGGGLRCPSCLQYDDILGVELHFDEKLSYFCVPE